MENTNPQMPAGDGFAAPKPESENSFTPSAQAWSMPNEEPKPADNPTGSTGRTGREQLEPA